MLGSQETDDSDYTSAYNETGKCEWFFHFLANEKLFIRKNALFLLFSGPGQFGHDNPNKRRNAGSWRARLWTVLRGELWGLAKNDPFILKITIFQVVSGGFSHHLLSVIQEYLRDLKQVSFKQNGRLTCWKTYFSLKMPEIHFSGRHVAMSTWKSRSSQLRLLVYRADVPSRGYSALCILLRKYSGWSIH